MSKDFTPVYLGVRAVKLSPIPETSRREITMCQSFINSRSKFCAFQLH